MASSEELIHSEVQSAKLSPETQAILPKDVTWRSLEAISFQVDGASEQLVIDSQTVETQRDPSQTSVSQTIVKSLENMVSANWAEPTLETDGRHVVSVNSSQEPKDHQAISQNDPGIVTPKVSLKEPSVENPETPNSIQPDASIKADTGAPVVKASRNDVNEEKVFLVEQHESGEKVESSAFVMNSAKEPVVMGPVEKGPAVPIDPHAVEVVQQVIRQLHGKLKSGPTSMHLQLNPESLGAIDVEVVKDVEGVSVTFFAEQSSTGKLLETQLSQLRQSLVDSGVQLSSLNIGQHNHSGQEGGFSHQNTEFAQRARQEDFQKKNDLKESSRAGQVTGQTSEVDYLI
jgi:flagellar hook-length control protein FliK